MASQSIRNQKSVANILDDIVPHGVVGVRHQFVQRIRRVVLVERGRFRSVGDREFVVVDQKFVIVGLDQTRDRRIFLSQNRHIQKPIH
jgi:hypothetical protein